VGKNPTYWLLFVALWELHFSSVNILFFGWSGNIVTFQQPLMWSPLATPRVCPPASLSLCRDVSKSYFRHPEPNAITQVKKRKKSDESPMSSYSHFASIFLFVSLAVDGPFSTDRAFWRAASTSAQPPQVLIILAQENSLLAPPLLMISPFDTVLFCSTFFFPLITMHNIGRQTAMKMVGLNLIQVKAVFKVLSLILSRVRVWLVHSSKQELIKNVLANHKLYEKCCHCKSCSDVLLLRS